MSKGIWNPVSINPPDEEVQVMDVHGREYLAQPTYYPFTIVRGKVTECEPYWDGWLSRNEILGEIILWRSL